MIHVPHDTLETFRRRVARDLTREPLGLGRKEHLAALAELVAALGADGPHHYNILGLAPDAEDGAVHAAYARRAGISHPAHAERLDFGDGSALEALFERVTESYLVLSDPDRRTAYDRQEVAPMAGRARRTTGSIPLSVAVPNPSPGAVPDAEERSRELREISDGLYLRALGLVSQEEFHRAISVLRQAVLMAPDRDDCWLLLGDLQAKNDRWLNQAHDSYHQAVKLDPKEPAYRFRLAKVLERMDDLDGARRQLQQVLVHDPEHPRVREELDRLEG